MAEAFFGTLKSELNLSNPHLTPEQVSAMVSDYIDNFHNPERRHSTLDYLNPIEYELKHRSGMQGT